MLFAHDVGLRIVQHRYLGTRLVRRFDRGLLGRGIVGRVQAHSGAAFSQLTQEIGRHLVDFRRAHRVLPAEIGRQQQAVAQQVDAPRHAARVMVNPLESGILERRLAGRERLVLL